MIFKIVYYFEKKNYNNFGFENNWESYDDSIVVYNILP